MDNNENKKQPRTGFFDVFIQLIRGTKPEDLHSYQKFNIVMTMLTALVILVLIVPPALSLVGGIIVAIGNVLISIFSTRPTLPALAGSSVSEWTYLVCVVILAAEFITCHFFCLRAIKQNALPPDPPPEGDK